ncbi:hypothetical protein N0V83_001290 [Neocucurbitaria cava]|uniref:Uncharacterized protein n=1 Tax=Neocucurbitaria cava TaxID=798079 RepID=A0A9W8YFE7_9PLEO|nr:hypothetical protein N0V83_001290 [Neocucurbitaria cava]
MTSSSTIKRLSNENSSIEAKEDDTIYMVDNELIARFFDFDRPLSKSAYIRTGKLLQRQQELPNPPSIALRRQIREDGKTFARHNPPKIFTHPAWVEFLKPAPIVVKKEHATARVVTDAMLQKIIADLNEIYRDVDDIIAEKKARKALPP